ncbi:MAG: DUF459 domain-containing protein [Xanthobacteraceae bacterium]|nr:MAG: DUF459 domain-containing protein [Xanthobacteraceae bacterium]
MAKRILPWRILRERGPLMAVAAVLLLVIAAPASAQFFLFGRPSAPPPPGPPSDFPFFSPFGARPRPAPAPTGDFSRAPPPRKSDTVPERHILVLGDAMADWLAYGLEDAFAETPDIGVTRKHKTISGLIRYQPKGEPADWAAAARGIVASEQPSVIVVMLGLSDRMDIREAADKAKDVKKPEKKADKPDRKAAKPATEAKPDVAKPDGAKPEAAPSTDAEQATTDDNDGGEPPAIAAPEGAGRSANGVHEFRSAKWVELYSRKIEEMIGVLKAKGVPVLWVGLPAVRGPRATSDTLYLNALYREGASKAGIPYVDVWDGFVDENGRFLQQGPDVEGQTRRLRSADGVYFTKAGARKLAHYVEREIHRVLATKVVPVALPTEPALPDGNARPGGPAPRPLAGPIVPLVAPTVGSDELLGGAGTRPAAVDALAARTLVKGEPLAPPAGRADDFLWPRREVGPGEAGPDAASGEPAGPSEAVKPRPSTPAPVKHRAAAPRPPAPPPGPPPGWEPRRDDIPRPPGMVGRSTFTPGLFR